MIYKMKAHLLTLIFLQQGLVYRYKEALTQQCEQSDDLALKWMIDLISVGDICSNHLWACWIAHFKRHVTRQDNTKSKPHLRFGQKVPVHKVSDRSSWSCLAHLEILSSVSPSPASQHTRKSFCPFCDSTKSFLSQCANFQVPTKKQRCMHQGYPSVLVPSHQISHWDLKRLEAYVNVDKTWIRAHHRTS